MMASERTAAMGAGDAMQVGADLDVRKMPAHWLMARLGKRVLRPGGLELTRWLLEHASITPQDDVIELAPGLARTAALILARRPNSYTGIERDTRAAQFAERALASGGFDGARILRADAASVPLADGAASLLVGEAMLSMQTAATKHAIIREAHRLLRPGGRYVIHELAVAPDSIDPTQLARIHTDLSSAIHVGVRIGTVHDWQQWLEHAGFTVEEVTTAPMHLLEPGRLIRDEGLFGALRFAFNAMRTRGAARRLRAVRHVFRLHRQHLCAVALIARRSAPVPSTEWPVSDHGADSVPQPAGVTA
jgi:SAM-dependent methyltransferase